MSAGFAAWAVEALIASTLLMAFVLAVRKPAQRVIGPQLAYWLWALPVLRMALPPLPAGWRSAAAAPISAARGTVLVYIDPGAGERMTEAAPGGPSLLALVVIAWLIIGLGFFAWHGLSHLAYVRRILRPPARRAQLADGTTLVESDAATGPVAFGVLKRFVAVPSDFAERYEAEERKLALAHELGHHARGDLIANWVALTMLALHWFNPIAWIAYRRFRADQEAANDARVLASLQPIERHAYACAIVKAAHGRAVAAACHLHTIEDLKGRLRMLKANRKSRRVLMAGALGIAGLTMAGLGLTASSAAAEKLRAAAAPRAIAAIAPIAALAQDGQGAATTTSQRHSRVVIVENGQRTVYDGPDADAYIASHPDTATPPPAVANGDGPPPPPAAPGATRRFKVVRIGPDGQAGSSRWVVTPTAPMAPMAPMAEMPRMAAMPTMPNVPEVRSANCGGGDERQMVEHKGGGDRQVIVICQNRIQRAAARGAVEAARSQDIQRNAYTQALAGLRDARARVAGNRDMSDEDRREALGDIDESLKEIESDLAHLD